MKWIDGPGLRIPYYTFENIEDTGAAVCAFTTRLYRVDGVWNDFYQPLLCRDSDPSEVAACVQLLTEQFGIDREHLVPSAQKHTANIYKVTETDIGAPEERPVLKAVDGLITDLPGVMLQTFGADCPSVYLVDPVNRAIGLCHSGRKGTQSGIAGRMLSEMTREYGTDPGDVQAAISPGICKDCYEVDEDVAEDFMAALKNTAGPDIDLNRIVEKRNVKFHLDLNLAIIMTLEKMGISKSRIGCSDLCTRCRDDRFYSFRAQGCITNENSALLMLRA